MFLVAFCSYEVRENRSAVLEVERVGHTHTHTHTYPFYFKKSENFFVSCSAIDISVAIFQCQICVQNDKKNVVGNLY